MKKSYIIGAIILLSVVSGFFAAYGYGHDPKEEYQKALSYSKNKNYQKAFPLFKDAAKQGYTPAEVMLGYMYLLGKGASQDYIKAVYWYKKAAEQGLAQAEYNLGVMYAKGLGVPQDYNKACLLYTSDAADE